MLDSTRFGLFLMCFNTAYKLVLCLMRRMGSLNDAVNAPVAGFVSGLTLAMDSTNRRQFITVFVMSRAFDSAMRMGEASGVIKNVGRIEWTIWLTANVFLLSAMGLKPGILSRGIKNFFQTWSQMSANDKKLSATWQRMLADGVASF